MEALTDIQQAVYDYTRKALQQGQPFPSLREIAQHFGFQHTTARFHLKALEKKGYVRQRSQRVSDYLLPDLLPDQSHEIEMHAESFSGSFDLVARIPAGVPSPVFDETPQSFSVTLIWLHGFPPECRHRFSTKPRNLFRSPTISSAVAISSV